MDKIFVSISDFTSETGLKEGRQTTSIAMEAKASLLTKIVDVNQEITTDKGKKSKFEKLLENTNDAIKKIADKLGDSVNTENNISEMEIEFGIGFTEGLNLKIFEIGSNQSIKVKVKIQKQNS
jgi:predicted  nucleic acid-binding Zn-ribbon protein